jgi:uncharacterized protein HemY
VAGRHPEALHILRSLEQADPNSLSPHRYLRIAYIEMGDFAAYLSETKKEASLLHDASLSAIAEAAEKGFAAHGFEGMLESQLQEQKKAYSQGKLSPFFLAETYSRLGQKEEAMKYMEACYDRHADETLNFATDPAFNNLHPVPAFQQLLAKAGMAPVN